EGRLHPVHPLPGMPAHYRVWEVEAVVDGGRASTIAAQTGHTVRLLLSNLVLVVAVLLAIFPLFALLRGSAVLAVAAHPRSAAELIGVLLAAVALLAGSIFFLLFDPLLPGHGHRPPLHPPLGSSLSGA